MLVLHVYACCDLSCASTMVSDFTMSCIDVVCHLSCMSYVSCPCSFTCMPYRTPTAPAGGKKRRSTAMGSLDRNSVGGKRPLSSMAPTMVFHHGEPYLAIGSPGGSRIIGTVLNTLVNVIDGDMCLGDAIAAPRALSRNAAVEVSCGNARPCMSSLLMPPSVGCLVLFAGSHVPCHVPISVRTRSHESYRHRGCAPCASIRSGETRYTTADGIC